MLAVVDSLGSIEAHVETSSMGKLVHAVIAILLLVVATTVVASSAAVVLHDRSLKKPGVDIVDHGHLHSIVAGLEALQTRLHVLEPGLVGELAVFEVLDALVHLDEERLHAHKALVHIVREAVNLVSETAHRLSERRVLLAGRRGRNAGLVVVAGLLDGEAPLITQLDLADRLGAPRAVDLAGGRVALLGGAGVLDAAAVADEVVPGRFAIAVVGGAKLDDTVPLVLGDTLDGAEKILKVAEDALGRGEEGRRRRRGGEVRHRD